MKGANPYSKMFYIDETETELSSQGEKNHPYSFTSKKSLNSIHCKTFLEESEMTKPSRKLTLETPININNLVPHPKALEIKFVPSKLRLNTKGFKDLKCNQKNKILLDTNNYYISCPNSEDTESSEEFYCFKQVSGMKKMRKKMTNIKNNLPKILSKNIVSNCGNKMDIEEDKGYNDEDLYSGEELNNDDYVLASFETDKCGNFVNKKSESGQDDFSNGKSRLNSCSILQILENNIHK